MIVGNFNYHQILFALDTFKLNDEKLGYLEKINSELDRVIKCFEAPKALPLKMYASDNINIDDSCKELKEYIKKQFEIISTNPYDKRYPGEGELRGLVRSELINYKKLRTIVNDEINNIIEKIKSEAAKVTPEKEVFFTPKKVTPSHIAKLIKNNPQRKIVWENSIGELIDMVKILIILELYPGLNEKKISAFICEHFVNPSKEKYQLNQIDKVYKMLQNTLWKNNKNNTTKFFQ
jgi:hypothetical protein